MEKGTIALIGIGLVAIIALAIAAYAVFYKPAATTTTTTITASVQTLALLEKEYSITPNNATLLANAPISIKVQNSGALEHNFYCSGIGGTATIPVNGIGYLNISKNQFTPANYSCFSTLAGDRDLGMKFSLQLR